MSKTNESLVCPCWTNLMENMNTLFDSFFKKKNVKSIPDTLAIVGLKKALLLGMLTTSDDDDEDESEVDNSVEVGIEECPVVIRSSYDANSGENSESDTKIIENKNLSNIVASAGQSSKLGAAAALASDGSGSGSSGNQDNTKTTAVEIHKKPLDHIYRLQPKSSITSSQSSIDSPDLGNIRRRSRTELIDGKSSSARSSFSDRGKGASVEGSFTEMTFGKMKIPAEVLNSIPLSRDSSLAAANSNTPPTKQKTLTAQSSSMDKSDGGPLDSPCILTKERKATSFKEKRCTFAPESGQERKISASLKQKRKEFQDNRKLSFRDSTFSGDTVKFSMEYLNSIPLTTQNLTTTTTISKTSRLVSKNSMSPPVFCSASSLESNENPTQDLRNIGSKMSKTKVENVKSKNFEHKIKWGSIKDRSEKPGLAPIPSKSISSMESSTHSDGALMEKKHQEILTSNYSMTFCKPPVKIRADILNSIPLTTENSVTNSPAKTAWSSAVTKVSAVNKVTKQKQISKPKPKSEQCTNNVPTNKKPKLLRKKSYSLDDSSISRNPRIHENPRFNQSEDHCQCCHHYNPGVGGASLIPQHPNYNPGGAALDPNCTGGVAPPQQHHSHPHPLPPTTIPSYATFTYYPSSAIHHGPPQNYVKWNKSMTSAAASHLGAAYSSAPRPAIVYGPTIHHLPVPKKAIIKGSTPPSSMLGNSRLRGKDRLRSQSLVVNETSLLSPDPFMLRMNRLQRQVSVDLSAANTIVEEKSITDSTSSGDESSTSCQSDTMNKPIRTSTNQRRKLKILATSTDTDNDITITSKITNNRRNITNSADKNYMTSKVKNVNTIIDNSSPSAPFIEENSTTTSDSNSFKNDENTPVGQPEIIPGNTNPVGKTEILENSTTNTVQTSEEMHGKIPAQTQEINLVTNPEIHDKPVKRTIRRTAMQVTCL